MEEESTGGDEDLRRKGLEENTLEEKRVEGVEDWRKRGMEEWRRRIFEEKGL